MIDEADKSEAQLALEIDETLEKTTRSVFRQGMTVIVGSGWSVGKGLPSMGDLNQCLAEGVEKSPGFALLSPEEKEIWESVSSTIDAGVDFEQALDLIRSDGPLLTLVEQSIAQAILPREGVAIESIVTRQPGFTDMSRLISLMRSTGDVLNIVTTNYDRLIEYSSRTADVHVDDLFAGRYIGELSAPDASMEQITSFGSRKFGARYRTHVRLSKPHGSLDWIKIGTGRVVRADRKLEGRTQIVSPGLSKLQRGYEIVFDEHRRRANEAIKNANSLLFIGYGFNDTHLQQQVDETLGEGRPALLLTKDLTPSSASYLERFPVMCAIYERKDGGSTIQQGDSVVNAPGEFVWQLDDFLNRMHKI